MDKKGVNFSVFSKHARAVELLLFNHHDSLEPFQTIKLNSESHHTYHFWHVYIEGLKSGIFYAYRVEGPFDLNCGHRYNSKKILIDPYSKGISYALWKRDDALSAEDNLRTSLRSAVIDVDHYNWEGDKPLSLPLEETIIYEMHVGNFTKSSTSSVKFPGKFKGLIEKIPYLKSLGITAVELMPVFDFDTGDSRNVWGYGTLGFFAPESTYCTQPERANHVLEFRDLVKALHKAGLEVILDVVFGYTTEGDQGGTTLCFRGFDNSIYYALSPEDKQFYMNFSGCGNTLNTNHPVVSKFIQDCLEYWVKSMHVDGFRFDLASIMSRDSEGNILEYPHVLWNIDLSEKLVNTKMFAEPWDAGGVNLVGRFPGYRFVEWNGRFRDDMRRFVRGDMNMVNTIAGRITGSADLFEASGRSPLNSLNFITAHDGFTLYDLVSYNNKHNESNGENGQDGSDNNLSWNCGNEGETDDPKINFLRKKQIKNFLTLLFLSKGIPMVTMGDEVARTQKGNNNAYCQDNDTTWFDWNLVNKNSDILEFFKEIIRFRRRYRFFSDNDTFVNNIKGGEPEIKFHSNRIDKPDWENTQSRILAFTLSDNMHVMINMGDDNVNFDLPDMAGKNWYLAVDTADTGIGIVPQGFEKSFTGQKNFDVEAKSIAVFVAK